MTPPTTPSVGMIAAPLSLDNQTVGHGAGAVVHAPLSEGCHAGRDGDCNWKDCPQERDGEPAKSGRDCPLDTFDDCVVCDVLTEHCRHGKCLTCTGCGICRVREENRKREERKGTIGSQPFERARLVKDENGDMHWTSDAEIAGRSQ